MIASPWKRRIERSTDLLEIFPEAAELLKFYCRISRFQESIFDSLCHTGRTDLNAIAHRLPDLYAVIEADDVATLNGATSDVLATGIEGWQAMLQTYWDHSGYVVPRMTVRKNSSAGHFSSRTRSIWLPAVILPGRARGPARSVRPNP